MLLSGQPSAFKLFRFSTLIISCVIYLNYHIWRLCDWKGVTITPTPAETLLGTAIPEKIWYKLGPKGLSDQSRAWIDTCLKTNPTYQSEFMTDDLGDLYVKENFAVRPDIVETYLALPFPILKADFLRYLLLFVEGGIWSDIDVSCGDIPIHDWIPAQYKKDTSLVVGLEFDVGYEYEFNRQFASWMIMAKPGSPHMSMVIDDILEGLREMTNKHNVTVAGLTLDMISEIGDVCDLTGPRRMTRSIVKSLNLILNDIIDDRNISNLLEPKLIGDVLILPGYAFAASSNHYKEHQSLGPPLLTHHYAGSWKNENGGELA
jgi:alpha 1,6-mannosyltransferase